MKFVQVVSGPYKGQSGMVLSIDEETQEAEVELDGPLRMTSNLPLADLTIEERRLGLDEMWPRVEEAIDRRGFYVRLGGFVAQAARRAPEDLLAFWREFQAFERAVLAERDATRAAERARFEAAYGSLGDDEREKRWLEERERWTAYRTDERAATEVVARALLGDAEVDRIRIRAVDDADEIERRFIEPDDLRARAISRAIAPSFEAGYDLRRRAEEAELAEARRTHPLGSPPRPVASDLALEAALDDRDDDAGHAVYADWLQAHGDPRGELVALAIAGGDTTAQETAQLGALVHWTDAVELTWRRGWIDRARVAMPRDLAGLANARAVLEELLTLPSARFLRELVLGAFDYRGENFYEPLLGFRSSSLRSLFVGDHTMEDQELSWTSASLVELELPRLESLKVHAGALTFGALAFPRLRRFVVETTSLTEANIAEIAMAKWPELEELSLWLGPSDRGAVADVAQLAPILDLPWSKLKKLGLANAECTDAIVARLPSLPYVSQLEELDLSSGTMSDDGARALAALKLPLRRLDVDGNYLAEASLALLRSVYPDVHSQWQRTGEERYVAVGE